MCSLKIAVSNRCRVHGSVAIIPYGIHTSARIIAESAKLDCPYTTTPQRRYDTVDLYSGVNSNELLRLAFQARDQIAAFLSTCTVAA